MGRSRKARIVLAIDLLAYVACVSTFFMAFVDFVSFYVPLVLFVLSFILFVWVVKMDQ